MPNLYYLLTFNWYITHYKETACHQQDHQTTILASCFMLLPMLNIIQTPAYKTTSYWLILLHRVSKKTVQTYFLSEVCQILTDCKHFWRKDGREHKLF